MTEALATFILLIQLEEEPAPRLAVSLTFSRLGEDDPAVARRRTLVGGAALSSILPELGLEASLETIIEKLKAEGKCKLSFEAKPSLVTSVVESIR